jgi:hypothetical protein
VGEQQRNSKGSALFSNPPTAIFIMAPSFLAEKHNLPTENTQQIKQLSSLPYVTIGRNLF